MILSSPEGRPYWYRPNQHPCWSGELRISPPAHGWGDVWSFDNFEFWNQDWLEAEHGSRAWFSVPLRAGLIGIDPTNIPVDQGNWGSALLPMVGVLTLPVQCKNYFSALNLRQNMVAEHDSQFPWGQALLVSTQPTSLLIRGTEELPKCLFLELVKTVVVWIIIAFGFHNWIPGLF